MDAAGYADTSPVVYRFIPAGVTTNLASLDDNSVLSSAADRLGVMMFFLAPFGWEGGPVAVRYRSSTMFVLSLLGVMIRDKEAKSTFLVSVPNSSRAWAF